VIWLQGPVTVNAITVGCKVAVTGNNTCPAADLAPSIVIIDGNATFTGSPQFYGILYVRGSVTISGGTTVYGSLVTSGTVANNAGGSLTVIYHSDALQMTRENGPTTSASGTWRDFGIPGNP
jgi:hypothetical protein